MKTEQEQIKIMTKDEVKRALKMCADNCFRVCCPYGAVNDCCSKLKRDALTLITEQEKENEKLRAENEKYLDSIESVQVGRCRLRCPLTEQAVKQAKIDVLTELKKKYGFYICCSWCRATKLLGEIIDELIKEIEEGE